MLLPYLTVLIFLATLCRTLQIWPPHFGRHAWGSAIVVQNWLFIDGGELYTTAPGDGSFSILASTLAVDLSTSWTNATLPFASIAKPTGYPFARAQSIWYDPFTDRIFTRGGWRYEPDNCPNKTGGYLCSPQTWTSAVGFGVVEDFDSPAVQDMWQIQLGNSNSSDVFGSNSRWTQSPFEGTALIHQPPPDSGIPFGALEVSSSDTYYSLGACMPFPNEAPAYAYPGLLKLDLQTGQWSNQSRTNYAYNGYGAFGQAIFVQMYGEKGVLVFLGGYAPTGQLFGWGGDADPLQIMSQINIYDIATGKFLKQTATGDVPGPRWASCGVGVEDSNGGGFDIFIHGGFVTSQGGPYNADYANVFVLSLPSFRWTRVNGSHASMRALHSCAVIGQRQLVVVGGISSTAAIWVDSPDPWENGIGVFDMAALRWSAQYDANAAPYERAPSLASSNRANPYPRLWGVGVQQIFQQPNGEQNMPGNNSDTGSIAGGALGGILFLGLCAAVAYFITRRRKSQHRPNTVDSSEVGWFISKAELPSNQEPPAPQVEWDPYNREFNLLQLTPEIGSSATRQTEARSLTSEAQELEA